MDDLRRLGLGERAEVGQSLFCLGGGVYDGALVAAQNPEPMPDIARMTVVKRIWEPEFGTEEAGAYLGDQFLERIGIIPEALAKGAGQPVGVPRPMDRLVPAGGRIVIGRLERPPVGHLDIVEGRAEIGPIAAMPDLCGNGVEEAVDASLALRGCNGRCGQVPGIEMVRQS